MAVTCLQNSRCFSTGMRNTYADEKANLPESHITDKSSGILGLHFWMTFNRKMLQLLSAHMGVHID